MKTENSIKLSFLTSVCVLASLTAADEKEHDHGHSHDEVYELQDFVVTTGTRTERLLTEVPIKTEVLDKGAFEMGSLFELGQAIELLNGARTEANCQNCGTAEIQLLGLPGNYNQILVDGLPLFTGVASVYGIDQVPTLFIERIEIVKGGGSALYGPGAVAGVINLIPEEPFENHTHVDFGFRSIDGEPAYQTQFATYFVSEDKSFKASLYGLYGDQNEYDANGDGFSEIVERENKTIGTYLWWTPFDETRLRFNYQYIGEERRGGDRLGVPEEYAQTAESLDTDYHWATLRWDQELTSELSMGLSASMVQLDRDSYYGGTGVELIEPGDPLVDTNAKTYDGAAPDDSAAPGTAAAKAHALFGSPTDGTGGGSFNSFGETEATSYFFDAQFNYDLGELANSGIHHLVFGFQYEEETLSDDQLDVDGDFLATLHDDTFDNFGVFFQDEWQLTEKFEIVPGLRADKANTLDDWVFSPRIAARYTATSELTIRANFSSGFLAPRIFDEDIHIENIGGVPRDIVNADDLQEERSYTSAFGMDYTPNSFGGDLTTSIQFYYTILEDSYALDQSSIREEDGREKIDRINSDGSTIFGIEWDAAYRFNPKWSLDVGLAYSRARYDTVDPDRGTDKYNKTPDWTGLTQLNYRNEELFNAFFAMKWTGEMDVDRLDSVVPDAKPVETSDHFFVVDVGISKKFKFEHIDLTLRAGISNLLDDYQDDIERGAERDPGYVYGPRYPRSYTLGAKIDF
ncbi:MAG: outer membrane receptor for ferrienterochelin and colicins [Lentimonas sp.]|jgi:outer membrane receptor for ferrienterochelin and colicins